MWQLTSQEKEKVDIKASSKVTCCIDVWHSQQNLCTEIFHCPSLCIKVVFLVTIYIAAYISAET
jgi:hypothetical protein